MRAWIFYLQSSSLFQLSAASFPAILILYDMWSVQNIQRQAWIPTKYIHQHYWTFHLQSIVQDFKRRQNMKTPTNLFSVVTLHRRHNDHGGVSNHQPHGCLLKRLFRRKSKKTSKLRVTGLCVGNSPGPVNSPHKGPVTRKMFPFDDVIMSWIAIMHLDNHNQ